ncbi:hypothetical protein Plo01_12400 [Planobispora longispora]|uniref:Uncharacterized protein n=1 Tax=Planobispora longispora TaxID=28887 RepID=A0A8J3RIH3_9ACTN|nr:hypothetical protein Plo01_12400 [Planobispora longispora]
MVPTSNGEAVTKWSRALSPVRGGKRAGPDALGTGSAHSRHGGCLMNDIPKASERPVDSGSQIGSGSARGPAGTAWARPALNGA